MSNQRWAFFDLKVLALLASLCLFDCGPKANRSRLTDVGTDLMSGVGYGEFLYWVDGQNVAQARCTRGQPILKENCVSELRFLPYQEFSDRLLGPVKAQLATSTQNVSSWQREFNNIDGELRADPNNRNLQSEWRYIRNQLNMAINDLGAVQSAERSANEALRLLIDARVIHRILSTNSIYNNVRPFVAKFYEIFTYTLPPTPSPSKVTWVDPNTGKTWAYITEQMSWNDAKTDCNRRPGWRLPLSDNDFAAGDGSDVTVATRLFASPIGAALIQLPYKPVSGGSDFQARVIWTGDNTPSNDYGALLRVYADISGHGLSRYLHLLSSNSRYSVVCVKD
jgi:hypothetical protein